MYISLSNYKVISVSGSSTGEIIDYGVKMVGAPLEWSETMGEGVRVGIIDTGIDTDHPDLRNRIKKCADFTGAGRDNVEDENGHGTHVAGIIAAEKNKIGVIGVAPKADLYVAKAFGKDGKTEFSSVIKSINWLVENKVQVINMSFSSPATTKQYANLVSEVAKRGITMVCAAGNEGEKAFDNIGYPANYPETIAVTAVDVNKHITDFSSVGRAAEISAAGKDIYSTYLDGTYATLSGTSMATPIITGAVAILQAKGLIRYGRYLTPDEIRLLLNIYTEQIGKKGRNNKYGYGVFSFGRIGDEDVIEKSASINKFAIASNDNDNILDMLIAMLVTK